MSVSSNIKAGRAYVEIAADSGPLQRGLHEAEAKLRGFAASCTAIGRDMAALGGALTVPFAMSARSFADFDDRMRMTAAVSGATGAAFDALTKKAQKLGRETSFTAQQTADAMTALGRMGFRPQEIDNAIDSVLSLSRATGTELAESADIAANSLRIFGLESTEMSDVADVLTATANGSAQTLQDLFEALKTVGPQAHAAGESLRDTCAAIGVLANLGIKGSLAGTALRKSFAQFAKHDIQEKLAEVGVRATDADGNLRKMADTMADIGRVMAAMPSGRKLAFAQEIFDIRGAVAGLSLGGNTAQMEEFLRKLEDVRGVAENTSRTMDAGLGGSFRLLASAAEGAMNAVGEAVGSTLQPLTDRFTAAINAVTKWVEANKGVVTAAAAVAAGLAATGFALLAVGGMARAVAASTAALRVVVTALQTAFSPVAASVRTAVAAFRAFNAASAPALVSIANLATAFHAPIDVRANQVAASLLLMGRAETALAAKTILATRFAAVTTALKSLNAATVASALSTKAHAAAVAVSAVVAKAVAAARSAAAAATALFSASTAKATLAAGASAVANTLLAASAKLVAGGFLAASGAASAFCAIPIVAVIVAIVGAFYALSAQMAKATTYTANLSDSCRRLREENDKTRRSDEMRMQRLRQLAAKQSLSAKEMNEASRLTNILGARYGDLGITVDRLSGRIRIAADTQERFNAAMRKAAAIEVEAEIRELKRNISELQKENDSLQGRWVNVWNTITFRMGKAARDISANGEKIEDAFDKLRAARLRLSALEHGDEGAGTGDQESAFASALGMGEEELAASRDEAERAARRAAAIERQIDRENHTDLENRISDIRELRDEYKGLIRTMAGYEKSMPEPDEGKLRELDERLKDADKTAEAREARVRDEEARRNREEADEIGRSFAEAIRDVDERRMERERDRAVDEALANAPEKGIAMLRGILDEFMAKADRAREEFSRAMDEAMADGRIDEAESARLAGIRDIYAGAEGMVDRYAERLRSAVAGLERANESANRNASGSFFASALQAFGGTDFYKRTANATEQTLVTARRILASVRTIAETSSSGLSFT